jgi:hypothetical protein
MGFDITKLIKTALIQKYTLSISLNECLPYDSYEFKHQHTRISQILDGLLLSIYL